jgi:hypothetical protein
MAQGPWPDHPIPARAAVIAPLSKSLPLRAWDRHADRPVTEWMKDSPQTYVIYPRGSFRNWLEYLALYDWLLAAYGCAGAYPRRHGNPRAARRTARLQNGSRSGKLVLNARASPESPCFLQLFSRRGRLLIPELYRTTWKRSTGRNALSLSPRQTSAYTLADHGSLEVAAMRQLI